MRPPKKGQKYVCTTTMSFTASQYLMTFPMRSENKCFPFKKGDDEGHRHLEDAHNSVTQYWVTQYKQSMHEATKSDKAKSSIQSERPRWDQGYFPIPHSNEPLRRHHLCWVYTNYLEKKKMNVHNDLKRLLSFPTTYLCGANFSSRALTQTTQGNRWEYRTLMSPSEPHIQKIYKM